VTSVELSVPAGSTPKVVRAVAASASSTNDAPKVVIVVLSGKLSVVILESAPSK
jgi:hypothetical protein